METNETFEEYVVVRILHYDDSFKLLFSDMSSISIPNGKFEEPKVGDRVSIMRGEGDHWMIRMGSEFGELPQESFEQPHRVV